MLVLATAATLVVRRLKLPPIAGYLVAGLVVGPSVPITLVTEPDAVRTLAELGVVLLMFSIGLEFRLRRLVRVGGRVAAVALVENAVLLSLGYLLARAVGWSGLESIFAGAIIAISSTMVISRIYAELRPDRNLRDLVFGVLVMEDLVAIVLVAALTTLAHGDDLTPAVVWSTLGRLVGVLAAFLVVGMLLVPRFIRRVVSFKRPEITVVAALGLAFGSATLSQHAGYSVALGAFLAGSLIAESGASHQVAEAVEPIRDLFGAIFFVAVGMLVQPTALAAQWPMILLLSAAVVVGKVVAVSSAAFFAGFGVNHSIRAGLSLAQIGEFSFVIAGLGLSAGQGDSLYAVAVGISLVTTFLTPFLVANADRVALAVDRHLPKPIQLAACLYGSWFELLGTRGANSPWRRARRLTRFLVLDALLLAGALIVTSILYRRLPGRLSQVMAAGPTLIRPLLLAAGALVAFPFALGLTRNVRRLARMLAEAAMPPVAPGKVDQALAPRRTLTTALQIGGVIVIGVPLAAVTMPFLPPFGAPGVIVLLLLLLGIALWRNAKNLDSHVRAGAELVVHVLAKQGSVAETGTFEAVGALLPGLGTFAPVRIESGRPVVGKTLGELNLRGRTGATVVALSRGTQRIPYPSAGERLQAGDLIALAGSQEAVQDAEEIFRQG